MAIWLIRGGKHGQHEQKFLHDNRVYATWDRLAVDLSQLEDQAELRDVFTQLHPDAKPKKLQNWASQVWPFAHKITKGDLVVLPLKSQPAVHIGEVTGNYHFEKAGPNYYYHWLPVKWIGEEIPRSHFGMDLLYTFGALMTICRVQRNNAEARILAMRANGWKAEAFTDAAASASLDSSDGEAKDTNLEDLAHDEIAQLIAARFKGHGLTRLVEAILKAQGYTTYLSPEGADGGADILAGAGPLGFGAPRLVVEVKSGDAPIDRPTVDKLLGAVHKFKAQEGLFVSWSGFKNNVFKDMAPSFFSVRLWTRKEFLEALFINYDRLDDDLKAELPLKRIWTVAAQDDDE